MVSKWMVSSEVMSSKIKDKVILMSLNEDSYFGMDFIGSRIWELLSQKPATVDELVASLMEEYEIDEDNCRSDIGEFLADMLSKGLIEQTGVNMQ